MDTENNSQEIRKNKIVIIAVASFLVGFAISWLLFSVPTKTSPAESENSTSTPFAIEESSSAISNNSQNNFVSASDQSAGNVAFVELVRFSSPGWVAIHEDRDGGPGNILGAAWLPAGERNNVKVELLRRMVKSQTYYAILHSDNGDKKFDYKEDLPIKDSEGSIIISKFNTK